MRNPAANAEDVTVRYAAADAAGVGMLPCDTLLRTLLV